MLPHVPPWNHLTFSWQPYLEGLCKCINCCFIPSVITDPPSISLLSLYTLTIFSSDTFHNLMNTPRSSEKTRCSPSSGSCSLHTHKGGSVFSRGEPLTLITLVRLVLLTWMQHSSPSFKKNHPWAIIWVCYRKWNSRFKATDINEDIQAPLHSKQWLSTLPTFPSHGTAPSQGIFTRLFEW